MVDKLEAVEVTQADREKAARLREQEYERHGIPAATPETPTEMRRGQRDWDPFVQVIARERLAVLNQRAERAAGNIPTPANGEQVERVARALADRFIARGKARVSGSWYASYDDMPGSYRNDFLDDARAAIAATTPTEDARSRVKVLEEALLRIAETDRHTRRVKCNPNGGLRGQAGMIAVFALTGKNGSYLTDADVRTALGNKETDRHGLEHRGGGGGADEGSASNAAGLVQASHDRRSDTAFF